MPNERRWPTAGSQFAGELARATGAFGAPSSLTECVVVLAGGGFMNAQFVETLMGWPLDWTDIALKKEAKDAE